MYLKFPSSLSKNYKKTWVCSWEKWLINEFLKVNNREGRMALLNSKVNDQIEKWSGSGERIE